MAAVSRGWGVDVVEVLVKAGVGVEGVDAAGKPLLNVATRLRNADVVRMLVEVGGADVKQTWAGGYEDVVEVLLSGWSGCWDCLWMRRGGWGKAGWEGCLNE